MGDDPPANPKETSPSTFTVAVEVNAWVNSLVGGPMSGATEFQEPATTGDTIEDVLRRLSARFPKLNQTLWEGGQLGPHLELIVNDTILGVDYQVDSPVDANTRIMITGQFVGG